MKLKKGIQIINTVVHHCISEKTEATVAVVDQNGELVTFARTDLSPKSTLQLTINKAYTAVRMKKETELLAKELNEENLKFYFDNKLTPIAGGVPIFEEETLVGGIGISSSDLKQDIDLAKKALASIQPKPKKDDSLKLYS